MKMPKALLDLLRKSPFWIFVAIVVALLAIGENWEKFETLRGLMTRGVVAGLEIEWEQQNIELSVWFGLLLLVMIGATVAVPFFMLRAKYVSGVVERRSRVAAKTLQKMMAAASQIRDQQFPSSAAPTKKLVLCEATYLIHKNFDLDARIRYELHATKKPLHFVECDAWVEDVADEMEFFDDIRFKITDGKNDPMPYLPSTNDQHYKAAMVYFLPEIEAAEASPRTLILSYFWPGGFKKLGTTGLEEYTWHLASTADIPRAVYGFFLEPGTEKALTCQITGSTGGNQSRNENAVNIGNGWKGCEYKLENAPPGEYKLTLKLGKPK
jgi:hypothetical protein